jgi:inhibitor of KinA sporulation pathway (predicted exonuclease)
MGDNRNHYKRKGKRGNGNPKSKLDIVLLIDLEATCWRGHPPTGMRKEIIEIGIAGIDYRTKEIKFKDSILVKPQNSEVSKFCTELTSITQEMLDEEGVTLEKACKILEEKYSSRGRVWMSWSDFDKKQFLDDCEFYGLTYPLGKVHFDMKVLFSFAYGLGQEFGVESALAHLGMEFDGNAHRGVDDAYNIARILQKVFFPIMQNPLYGPKDKKEHEKLVDYLDNTYTEEQLKSNATRVANKTTTNNKNI